MSTPALASSAARSRPAGPAPTMATWVLMASAPRPAAPPFARSRQRAISSRSRSRRQLAAPARVVVDERGELVEHRVDGLGERPRDEAGADRAAAVDAREAEVVGIGRRHPERQLVPRRDALLEQERLGDGDEAQRRAAAPARGVDARLEHFGPAAGAAVLRPGRVEGAARVGFDGADDPVGEVANVDQLDRLVAAHVGNEDLAAGQRAPRPVAEAAGAVARADDEARGGRSARARRTPPRRRARTPPSAARSGARGRDRLRRCRRWQRAHRSRAPARARTTRTPRCSRRSSSGRTTRARRRWRAGRPARSRRCRRRHRSRVPRAAPRSLLRSPTIASTPAGQSLRARPRLKTVIA